MKKLLKKYIPLLIGSYFNALSFINEKKTAKKAFHFFCTPRKGKVIEVQEVFLENAKDLVLTQDNISIQTYKWQGTGPIVLLMHGWESNTFRWRNLIAHLQSENFNIISMDAPAHGHSSGQLLNLPLYSSTAQKVIDHYKPDYVIGHSLGGMAILHNVYKYKTATDGIKKIVTLGSPSELTDFMRQYKAILSLSSRMMRLMEDYFTETFGAKFADFSSAKFAKHVSQPGLLIHDEYDKIAPIWSSEEVHANWRNSTLIKTKNFGHSLHQDEVTTKVIAFLNS